jgi:hypothetical protein
VLQRRSLTGSQRFIDRMDPDLLWPGRTLSLPWEMTRSPLSQPFDYLHLAGAVGTDSDLPLLGLASPQRPAYEVVLHPCSRDDSGSTRASLGSGSWTWYLVTERTAV